MPRITFLLDRFPLSRVLLSSVLLSNDGHDSQLSTVYRCVSSIDALRMYNAEKIANRRTHPSIRRMRSTRFSNSLQFEEIGSRDVDVSDMVGYERFRGRGLSRVAAFEPALIIFHYCEPPRPAIVPRPSKDHPPAPTTPLSCQISRDRALLSTPRSGRDSPRFDSPRSLRWTVGFRGTRRKTITVPFPSGPVFKGEVGS